MTTVSISAQTSAQTNPASVFKLFILIPAMRAVLAPSVLFMGESVWSMICSDTEAVPT